MGEEARAQWALRLLAGRDRKGLWGLVESYMVTWGRSGSNTSAHTLKAYRSGVNLLLDFFEAEGVGDAEVLRGRPELGARYLRWLEAREVGGKRMEPSAVNARRVAARTFYRALRWAGVTQANPFDEVPSVRDNTPRWEKRQPYSAEEVERLAAAAADDRERALVLLGAYGGLRIGEAVGLRREQVDLGARRVTVTGKGRKTRTVRILSRQLEEVLRRLLAEGGEGALLGYASDQQARRALRALAARAGVAYRGRAFHSLRHHAGTEIYRKTRNLDAVAKHLGHSNINTSQIYAKFAEEMLEGIFD